MDDWTASWLKPFPKIVFVCWFVTQQRPEFDCPRPLPGLCGSQNVFLFSPSTNKDMWDELPSSIGSSHQQHHQLSAAAFVVDRIVSIRRRSNECSSIRGMILHKLHTINKMLTCWTKTNSLRLHFSSRCLLFIRVLSRRRWRRRRAYLVCRLLYRYLLQASNESHLFTIHGRRIMWLFDVRWESKAIFIKISFRLNFPRYNGLDSPHPFESGRQQSSEWEEML